MFGPIKNVIFDLDGTLVDTMSKVIDGIVVAASEVRGEEVSRVEAIENFSPSTADVLGYWTKTEAEKETFFKAWGAFNEGIDRLAFPFPGIDELLNFLSSQKVPFFIFTGRGRKGSLRVLSECAWLDKYFTERQMVCGDDPFSPKPSPEGVQHLLETFKLKAEDTLLVGDHLHDLIAGREAGCKTAAALWDLSMQTQGSTKSKFREAWIKTSEEFSDLRLTQPSALKAWIEKDTSL